MFSHPDLSHKAGLLPCCTPVNSVFITRCVQELAQDVTKLMSIIMDLCEGPRHCRLLSAPGLGEALALTCKYTDVAWWCH